MFVTSLFRTFYVSLCALCHDQMIYSNRYYCETSGFHLISNCVFIMAFSNTGEGGAIKITGSANMNISDTTFYNCSVKNYVGGAIYFNALNVFLSKVCGNSCFSLLETYCGHFGCFQTSSANRCYFNMVSLTMCSPTSNKGLHSFWIRYGDQNIESLNSSKNFALFGSSLVTEDAQKFHFAYSNIEHCTTTNGVNIYLYGNKNGIVNSCNIINNQNPNSYGSITVSNNGNYTVSYSVFNGNTGYPTHKISGSLYVFYSYIDSVLMSSFSGTFNVNGYSSPILFKMFSTKFCEAQLLRTHGNQKVMMNIFIFFHFSIH